MASLRERVLLDVLEAKTRGWDTGADLVAVEPSGNWPKVKSAILSLKRAGLIEIRRSQNDDDPYYSSWALTTAGERKARALAKTAKPSKPKTRSSSRKVKTASSPKAITATQPAKSTPKKKRGFFARLFG
jgi:DNA-binding MarR family transcriptional regulator